jgi:hypothetical protein
MFGDIKKRCGLDVHVNGYSWLYNIEAYRRLFPNEYLVSAMPFRDVCYSRMILWGQFLNCNWGVKSELTEKFFKNISEVESLERLLDSFEYYPLKLRTKAIHFYNKYLVD